MMDQSECSVYKIFLDQSDCSILRPELGPQKYRGGPEVFLYEMLGRIEIVGSGFFVWKMLGSTELVGTEPTPIYTKIIYSTLVTEGVK